MDLDRVTATLRPRDPWEGLDLGFALARSWFWPLWRLWCLTAAPIAMVCVGIAGARPDWWILAVWWLKPLFEVPLLLWVSQRLFGDEVTSSSVAEVLRNGWSRLRSPLPRQVLPYLLWRRLAPRRSFLMPVAVLEGLSGPAARQRRTVLNAGGGAATWLTLVCYHFEVILWGGLLLGLYLLVPEELPKLDLASLVADSESWGYWVSVLAYLLVFSVIAPFYVCAGFALYLTRRTDLEAWDLELAFRRVHAVPAECRRVSSISGSVRSIPALLIAFAVLLVLPATPTKAEGLTDPDRAKALIQEVLKGKAFAKEEEVTRWRAIDRDSDSEQGGEVVNIVVKIVRQLAQILKWTLLGAAVAVLALLLRSLLKNWRPDWFRRPERRVDPEIQGVADPVDADQPLPSDISTAVRERLTAGDRRGAMSLIYRASLLHLESLGLRLPDGATEGDCLTVAAGALPEQQLASLREIVRTWQGLAYAQNPPNPDEILLLLSTWCAWTTPEPAGAA